MRSTVPTSPSRPNRRTRTRSTLRDLNASRAISVFRGQSLLRRLVQLFTGTK